MAHPLLTRPPRCLSPPRWSRDRLYEQRALLLIRRMTDGADELLLSDVFLNTIRAASQQTKQEIKKSSYNGATYRRGRACDEGNYFYSVLFNIAKARATGEAREAIGTLLMAHPTLVEWDDCNEFKLYEFQGDIIECMLAVSRLTGSVIDPAVIVKRNRFTRVVVHIADAWDDLMRYLNRCYIPARHRPPTQNIVELMLYELSCVS